MTRWTNFLLQSSSSSRVLSYYSAAYSLNVAIQYPLLTAVIVSVTGIVLRHHPLEGIGSAAGSVLGGTIAHYYDWKPQNETNTLITLCACIASLALSSFGPIVLAITRITGIVLDIWQMGLPDAMRKSIFWSIGIVLSDLLFFFHPQITSLSHVDQIKLQLLVTGVYAGFLSLIMGWIKHFQEQRAK